MQEFPLTVDVILRRCVELGGAKEVVSVTPGGIDRRTWADVGRRALRLCRALDRLGVARGGRVGTFAWNGHRHVELHLAAPCSGRVVHPVNLRLTDDQIVYLVRHAGDEVVFVDASLTSQLAPLKDRLPVREFVVMEDGADVDDAFAGCPRYEELLAAEPPDFAVSGLDERDAAWICHTSGTTGNPKGVVATHRSVVLHALGAHGVDSHGISRDDTVLLTTALFHVGGWGMPYTCAFAPAELVLPGRDTSPDALGRLIEAERVTVATGVPTIWIQMEEAFSAGRYDLSSLRTVLCGGASATNALIRRINRHGIDFVQAWGMTEMSPSGTASRFRAGAAPDDPESRGVAKAGVAVPGVELRIVDERGDALPWDGAAIGELEARGPWVIRAYLDPDDDANETRFDEGWLRRAISPASSPTAPSRSSTARRT